MTPAPGRVIDELMGVCAGGVVGSNLWPLPCERKHGRPLTSSDASTVLLTSSFTVVAYPMLLVGCQKLMVPVTSGSGLASGYDASSLARLPLRGAGGLVIRLPGVGPRP